jgi:ribonucleases P/MRP protein subunit RPP40
VSVFRGVPQGSILGLLLFILYIKDIIANLDCNSYLYADDFKILSTVTSRRDNVNLKTNLNHVANWSRKHRQHNQLGTQARA